MMSEIMIIEPTWRGGQPFEVYRNPTARDRARLLSDKWRSIRFILTGAGDLIAGRSFEFTHHDAHTGLHDIYGANPVWMGELILDGPNMPMTFGLTPNPRVGERSPLQVQWDAEFNPSGSVCLARQSHYNYRGRGLLWHSRSWRRFTRGLDLGLENIPPLEGFVANQKVEANTRALLFLHTDGHLYRFDHGMEIWEAERLLSEAERIATPTRALYHASDSIMAMRLGGNGNMEIMFSDASDYRGMMRDNVNVRDAMGDLDFDHSIWQQIAITEYTNRGQHVSPRWESVDDC